MSNYITYMNKLDAAGRAKILTLLCEGMSIRAVVRVTGASKNTVAKLLVDAGKACAKHHFHMVRNVKAKRVQADEIWSFVAAKARNVKTMKSDVYGAGSVWTWTAIDADSKLIISYLVGGRDADYAYEFMHDVASRLANRVQLTTDGWKAYLDAVEGAFGSDVDYAQLVKIFGATTDRDGRYSPPECVGAEKHPITGRPADGHISTSYVERQNLTMRMHNRRFTRLTNAFSKKLDNHLWAIALHFHYYNFVRIHSAHRMTPAMAAGISDRLWDVSDIVALVEAEEVKKPTKRGPYKKRGTVAEDAL